MKKWIVTIGAAAILLMPAACKEKDQPAETNTMGNATDRTANGTTGTGEPASVATDTTAAAQSLGTVAPSKATGTVAITGTTDVHAASTETTSTIQGPGGTTTASVATPTDTTATFRTSTGTSTAATTKKH